MNHPMMARMSTTSQSCSEALAFDPAMFTTMKSPIRTTASGRLSMSTTRTR
jgi:hypothetical protein